MKKNYFLTFILILFCTVSFSQVSELYFSKYAEGSSNNKFLEIYNGTDADIDLSNYAISSCSNGCDITDEFDYPNNISFESGTIIASGDVYVIAHTSADASILSQADMTFGSLSNGDDAFALVQAGGDSSSYTVIDVIGELGEDPGSGWDVAGVTNGTQNHTLTRKSSICGPNSDWSVSAGTDSSDSEWIVTDVDSEWANLGSFSGCITSPTLSIVSPVDGSNVNFTDEVTIQISIDNFTVSSDASGDGYIKYSVNSGASIDKFDTDDISLAVTAGTTYVLYVELVDNSGNVLSTAVNQSSTFIVDFSCDLQLETETTLCDAETSGLDTYSVSIPFTGGNTSTYTISTDEGTIGGDDPSTTAEGTITITDITEGTDVVFNLIGDTLNSSCDLTINISSPICVSLPIIEHFDYTDASVLSDQTNWTIANSGDDILVSTGNLDYDGLESSTGNKISFDGSGAESSIDFSDVSSGTVYASFLLNVTGFQEGSSPDLTDGGYFAVLGNYDARAWVRPNPDTAGTTFDIGYGSETSSPTFTSTTYSLNDTLFIIISYNMDSGETNLWVNPESSSFEGTIPATTITGLDSTPASLINTFILRQDSTNETPFIDIDALRIATSWAEVTPKDATASTNENNIQGFSAYPNPISNGFLTLSTTSAELKEINIYNVLGKKVFSKNVSDITSTVNISDLTSGIYILNVSQDGNNVTKKLIIK